MLSVRYEVRLGTKSVLFVDADTSRASPLLPSAILQSSGWRCVACSFANEDSSDVTSAVGCAMCGAGSALSARAAQLQVLAAQLGAVAEWCRSSSAENSAERVAESGRRAMADVEPALQRLCKQIDDGEGEEGAARLQAQGIAALDLAARGLESAPAPAAEEAPACRARGVRFSPSQAASSKERTAGMGQHTTNRTPRASASASARMIPPTEATPAQFAALVRALRSGSVDAAERALADGCPVDTCLDGAKDVAGGDGVLPIERGDTALLAACRAAHRAMVALLLDQGASLDPHPRSGGSALHLAVRVASPTLLRIVLGSDRDGEWRPWRDAALRLIDSEDEHGEFVLHRSVRSGNEEVTSLLLEAGADPQLLDTRLRTPLHVAAMSGRATCAASLLEHCEARQIGGDDDDDAAAVASFIDSGDCDGNTPLHLAAALASFEVVEMLLQTACRTQLRNADGRTALEECRAAIRRAERGGGGGASGASAGEKPLGGGGGQGEPSMPELDTLRRCERIVAEYSESRSSFSPASGSSKTSSSSSSLFSSSRAATAAQHAPSVRAHVARVRWALAHWQSDLRRGSVVDVCESHPGEAEIESPWFSAAVVDVRAVATDATMGDGAAAQLATELLLTFEGYGSDFDVWLPSTSARLALRHHRVGDPDVWLAPGVTLDAWHGEGGAAGEGGWATARVVAVSIAPDARCADAVRDCIAAVGGPPASPASSSSPSVASRPSAKDAEEEEEAPIVLEVPPIESDCLSIRACDVVAVKLHWVGWEASWNEWVSLPEQRDRLASLHTQVESAVEHSPRGEGEWEVVGRGGDGEAQEEGEEGLNHMEEREGGNGGVGRRSSRLVRAVVSGIGSVHRIVQRSRDRRRAAFAEAGAGAGAGDPTAAAPLAAAASSKGSESAVPTAMCCPITCEVMSDPVMAADGHTYEKTAIEAWLAAHDTSPITNLVLDHKALVPNHALRQSIEQLERRGK